jgi:surface-anchored protein
MKCYRFRSIALPALLLVFSASVSTSRAQDCTSIATEVTFYFGIETPQPDVNHPVTVDLFHTDLEVSFTPAGWDVLVSYDEPGSGTGGRDVPPEAALLYGSVNARVNLPSIPPGFGFIGADAGETFWVLPQNEGNGALPLGVAAERTDAARLCAWNPGDLRGADLPDRWFRMELLGVRGPAGGEFSMWQADGVQPPIVYVSTLDGIGADDVYHISSDSHVHMNWGFTERGLYEVDFLISTVYRCDGSLTADVAPRLEDVYAGDCRVDFHDVALLGLHWLNSDCQEQPDLCEGTDLFDAGDGSVNSFDLTVLAQQWLACGYPGCETDN